MPHWYWDKKELRSTPSQLRALPFETESRYRREGVRFIIEVGKALNLSHTTMATGAVYFNRFYMFHAFQDFPRHVVATCCLFLAGKAEETPKKCKDIIRTVRALTNDRQYSSFGDDAKEEVMCMERVLLQTIKFDLHVEHPYSSIIQYAKCLKGDQNKLNKMVQMAWTFVNDSLCTTLCLQWEPEIIAIALMYLASKLNKFEVKDWTERKPHHKHWWDKYVEDLDTDVLDDICHQVLDLYAQSNQPAKDQLESPPQTTSTSSSSQQQQQSSSKPSSRSSSQPPKSKSRPHTPPPPQQQQSQHHPPPQPPPPKEPAPMPPSSGGLPPAGGPPPGYHPYPPGGPPHPSGYPGAPPPPVPQAQGYGHHQMAPNQYHSRGGGGNPQVPPGGNVPAGNFHHYPPPHGSGGPPPPGHPPPQGYYPPRHPPPHNYHRSSGGHR